MGGPRQAGRSEVGPRPLNPGVQGRLSFEEPPDETEPGRSRDRPAAATRDDAGERSGTEGRAGRTHPDGQAECPGERPALVVRVRPDVVTLNKTFDYAVPDAWHADGRAERLAIGTIVRVKLGRRRLRAWITEVGVEPPEGVELQPLAQLTGMGPPADVMSLAGWAAWRWAGRQVSLLRAASPPRVVAGPAPARTVPVASPDSRQPFDDLFEHPAAVTVLRCPPATDYTVVARAAVRRGDALIVVPGLADAKRIAADLRRQGARVALGFDDWARAAGGATVVGTRTAVWMPMPRLAAVVVLDEHSESLQSEQAPAWHARDVAVERARRAGVPAVLASAVPTLEALEAGALRTVGRVAERGGWPAVDVLDRRREDPVRGGLFAEGLRDHLTAADGRVAVVLNRKGRGRLLACRACGELARTSDARAPMRLHDDELVAADGSERRPVVCAQCGSTVLRILRMGVTRAREELAALAGEPIGEVTADAARIGSERIVIGTEAVLWRLDSAVAVVFLDFDQELLAPRQRASEQALALLARAARLVGGRRGGSRLVVQTRQPEHPVIQAAVRADPSIVASVEQERRRALELPPYGAQAKVSGPGAETFIAALQDAAGPSVSIRGPLNGQFLLRAPGHEPLLDVLARTPRPVERLRIEVDPLRV